MATKTKTTARSSRGSKTTGAKRTAKRSTAKTTGTAKTKTAKPSAETVKMRAVKLTNADGKTTRTVMRPVESHQFGRGGTVRTPEHQDAAERASALVCTDGDGQPTNRARIGSNQIALVAAYVKRTKLAAPAVLGALIGAKTQKDSRRIAVEYADGRLSIGELPDGARERIAEASRKIGEPKRTKLSGKATVGALVGLAGW